VEVNPPSTSISEIEDIADAQDAGQHHADVTPMWFTLNDESGELKAHFDPACNTPPTNAGGVKQAIEDAGFGKVHFDEGGIAEFVHQARSAKEVILCVVGQRRDAELSVTVADDLMTVSLTLIPAEGGSPVTMVMVNGMLREQGVSHGILHDQIDAALAAGTCEELIIAKGDEPIEGTETRFESLLDEKQKQLSHADDDETAVIKFRDLSHLLIVEPGDRLMIRIPAVQGTSGVDVKGQVAFAKALPELPFGDQFPGAAPDAVNPNLLRATLSGQPCLIEHGVTVKTVIEVEGVNLSTGSIKFDGTVNVDGDVMAGMRIEVTGDVIIRGTCEAAEIIAGGNVAIDGGIIGHADNRPGARGLPADTARIFCKGSVQALFVENAHIEAGDSILIERSVRQCELIALNDIVVGKVGSKISQIIGGNSQAKHLIKAMVLGSATGVKTHVQVGSDPFVGGEILAKEQMQQSKTDELDQLLKLMIFFRKNPKKAAPGMVEKVGVTGKQLMQEINAYKLELVALTEKAMLDEEARIEVSKGVHYGVEVKIGKSIWQANDDMPGTIIGMQEGKIATGLQPATTVAPASDATIVPTAAISLKQFS
jgi:uncharacterized protein (DUF342 family)